MFDPSIGRWITEDPLGRHGGRPSDVYTYATRQEYTPPDDPRYVDPVTMQWVSSSGTDPHASDSNLYRYVYNQPTNLTDPSGLEPPLFGGASITQMFDPVMYHPPDQTERNRFKDLTGVAWSKTTVRVYVTDYFWPNNVADTKARLKSVSQFFKKYGLSITWDVRRIKTPPTITKKTYNLCHWMTRTAHPYEEYLSTFDVRDAPWSSPRQVEFAWYQENFNNHIPTVFYIDDANPADGLLGGALEAGPGVAGANFAWVEDTTLPGNPPYDLVTAHELGHVFGLRDATTPEDNLMVTGTWLNDPSTLQGANLNLRQLRRMRQSRFLQAFE